MTFMSAFMLGHSPIPSLILKACLYFIIICISLAFSLEVRVDSFKSTLDFEDLIVRLVWVGHQVPTRGMDLCHLFPCPNVLMFVL